MEVIYNKAFNESFHTKLESLQYDTTLTIIAVIRGSSFEEIQEELGLESLQYKLWYRKMFF